MKLRSVVSEEVLLCSQAYSHVSIIIWPSVSELSINKVKDLVDSRQI